jgi:hypothetical protein
VTRAYTEEAANGGRSQAAAHSRDAVAELAAALAEVGLAGVGEALHEAGVHACADLARLGDDDLAAHFDLPRDRIAALRAAVRRIPTDATQALRCGAPPCFFKPLPWVHLPHSLIHAGCRQPTPTAANWP